MAGIWDQLLRVRPSQKREQSMNGITVRESSPAAADTVAAAPNGEPQNPVNSETPEPNCSTISAENDPPHHDQDVCDAPLPAGQPPNPTNSETSVNEGGSISAGEHASSQDNQETPAAVSTTTTSASPGNAQNPESTTSVNDEVNVSMQPNASTAAIHQNEGEHCSQSPTGALVQESEESNSDNGTVEQMAPQRVTNSYEQFFGE